MSERSYVGIDSNDNNEWIAVLCGHGKSVLSRPFKNTPSDLEALARFISERCQKPKICLNPANPNSFNLINNIGRIPDVEVVLISNAGLNMHIKWLPKNAVASAPLYQVNSGRAYFLACCAERIF